MGLFFLTVCLIGNSSEGFDGLPLAADLLREAESEHDRFAASHGEPNALWLMKIADAKVWQGDIDGALQTALSVGQPLCDIAAMSCVEIHLKRTGEIRRLPEALFEEVDGVRLGYWHYRCNFAKTLYSLERRQEALAFLPADDSSVLSMLYLTDFHVHAGEHDLQKERAADARQHFSEAISLLNRAPERRYSRDAELFLRAARGLTGVGDQAKAEKCRVGLSRKLKVSLLPEKLEKLKGEAGAGPLYLAQDCARLGAISSTLGNRARANDEFRFAQSLLTLPETTENDRGLNDYEIHDRLKTAVEIAVWQCESGFNAEGAAVIEQTVDRSIAIRDSLTRQTFLKRAIEAFCETGYLSLAANVVQSLDDGYWKCSSLCVIARAEFQNGEKASAKLRIQAASELCSKVRSLDSKASMWISVAEVQSEIADRVAARESYLKALAVSDESDATLKALGVTDANALQAYHQQVCRSQIRMGYLDDAYRTLKLIRNPDDRGLPLAELALAASKAGQ